MKYKYLLYSRKILDGTFVVHGVEVIPWFEVAHIIKCIRNNLVTKHLEVDFRNSEKNSCKYANWDHVITAYEIDIHGNRENRMMPKLTNEHMYEEQLKKMSVSHCFQVFSNMVANTIDELAENNSKYTNLIITFLVNYIPMF